MEAVAITDHGNMFGALDFYTKGKEHGIKPILGCEVYMAPGSRLMKRPGSDPVTTKWPRTIPAGRECTI